MSLPSWPKERILREAVDYWKMVHKEALEETGLFSIVLAYLRHSFTNYDAVLSLGGNRDQLQREIREAAVRRYQWLRPELTLPAKTNRPEKALDRSSRELSDLVTRRSQLTIAIRSSRQNPALVRELREELRNVEARFKHVFGLFEVRNGEIEIIFRHNRLAYLYAGYELPASYTEYVFQHCSRCGMAVMRSKRPLDHGAGIHLMAYSCLCLSISNALPARYHPSDGYWEMLTDYDTEYGKMYPAISDLVKKS